MWLLLSMVQVWALPRLPGGLDKLFRSPEEKSYTQDCQQTLDELDRLEKEVGVLSKDNVKDYDSAHLNLGYVVGACANIQTKFGSALQKKQFAAIERLYQVFLEKHKLIDLHGNGSSYDSTAQNIFTADVPLSPSHFLCQPERMDVVDSFIAKSWLTSEVKTLEQTVHEKTPLVDFENRLAKEYDNFVSIAKQKANQCLENKLDQVRPYTNEAPESVQKEWESAIRAEVANHAKVEIARIVYPYAQFRRFTENKREIMSDGRISVQRMDYDVMDAVVYVVNGEFVDGYIVSLYKDYIQKSEYARFYGLDANGKLRPSQRLLKSNF